MTARKLYDLLGKMIVEQKCGRAPISVDKPSFVHNLESDGAVIMEVDGISLETVTVIDDDGFTKTRKDGSECYRTTVVLTGAGHPSIPKQVSP